MKKTMYLFFILVLLIFFHFTTRAETIIIPDYFATVQQGLDAAADGDTVLVRPGIYPENLVIEGRSIVIGSMTLILGDTSYISQTILDGNQTGSVIKFQDITGVVKLCGFTVRNGKSNYGGGILIDNCSDIILEHILVVNNLAFCDLNQNKGGGICCYSSSLTLSEFNIISNLAYCITPPINPVGGGLYAWNSMLNLLNGNVSENQAYLGGGIYLEGTVATIESVNFIRNNADFPGSAICAFGSNLNVQGSVFDKNTGDGRTIYAEGVLSQSYNLLLTNCLFTHNEGGVNLLGHYFFTLNQCSFAHNTGSEAVLYRADGDIHMINSIFWNDFTEEINLDCINCYAFLGYSDIRGGMGGITGSGSVVLTGPIYDIVPGFVSDTDLHLSDQSQCIGAGIDTLTVFPNISSPEIDIELRPRPFPDNSMPDLGAYENPLANPLTGITSEESVSTKRDVLLFPNPAEGHFFIVNHTGETIYTIQIFDISGRSIYTLSNLAILDNEEMLIHSDCIGIKGYAFIVFNSLKQRFFKKIYIR